MEYIINKFKEVLIFVKKNENFRKYSLIIAVPVLIFTAGFMIGSCTGKGMISSLISGESRYPLLIGTPAGDIFKIYRLVNSENPLERISGYYALIDANMIDLDFLHERFLDETLSTSRLVLVKAISCSDKKKKMYDVLDAIYDKSEMPVKTEIVRTIYKNKFSLKVFSQKHDIKQIEIDGTLSYQ
jgi:hypothetical protein